MNSGITGGGGGAMSFHYLRGNISINESYFQENKTNGTESPVASTYDGGAIYILMDGMEPLLPLIRLLLIVISLMMTAAHCSSRGLETRD